MNTMIPFLLALLTITAAFLAGCHDPTDPDPSTEAVSHEELMAHARQVAAGLDSPANALDAGYLPGTVCESGMGVHWVNPALMGPELDEDRPAALLFLPSQSGVHDVLNSTFIGLEWLVVTEGLPTNTTETVPTLLGHPLDGPMAGHFPGMPWHADLHIYLAEGMESDEELPAYHEAVVCPEGTDRPPMATVILHDVTTDSGDAEPRGQVTFTEVPFLGMLMADVSVTGFASGGERAMHIHEHGDCGPGENGAVAGGAGAPWMHFPPLSVDEDGSGHAMVPAEAFEGPLTLEPGAPHSVLGRSVVVHAEDGSPELCGTIAAS